MKRGSSCWAGCRSVWPVSVHLFSLGLIPLIPTLLPLLFHLYLHPGVGNILHLDALIFGFSSRFRFMNHLPYFHMKKSRRPPSLSLSRPSNTSAPGSKSFGESLIAIFTERILEGLRYLLRKEAELIGSVQVGPAE